VARRVARSSWRGSRGFWLMLAVVAAAFGALRLSTSDRGQAFLVRYGITRHFVPQLGTRLDVALAQQFVVMGLERGDVKLRNAVLAGRRVREYSFASPQHLSPTLCHAGLRDAARRVSAEVLSAEMHHDKGDELELVLGFGHVPTHRILIRPAAPPPVIAGRPQRPRLALLVDDLGNNMNGTTRGILDLPVPFTIAVLPDLRDSDDVLEEAHKRGVPALLHLPMEPEGGADPGKHAIKVGMDAEAIEALVDKQLRRYKTVFGINNHMGSRATADRPTMQALMQVLRRRDLVFVDSQTTPHSLGRSTAREAGVWCVANDLFLDDGEESQEQVEANLDRLARMARKRGLAIGIAHPHPETLAALRAALPRLQADGYEFVTLESLRPAAPGRLAARTAER